MINVLPLISRIAESTSINDIWRLASAYYEKLGFGRANYGYSRFLYLQNVGDPDDAIFLTTGNADYERFYFQDGFYAKTPVFRWAVANSGACTWKWVQDAFAAGQFTAEEEAAVRQNVVWGITAGISISFPETSTRSKGALGLIADIGISTEQVEEIWQARRDELQAVAHIMHLRLITLPQPGSRRSLTERQRQALEWVADGKTTQDVALLMAVSTAMVEKHLRLARAALQVDTTTQAVAKASLLNLIFQRNPKIPMVGNS